MVDNTFATGISTAIRSRRRHRRASVTKYLAGHSDLIQGAVLARDAAVFEPIKFLQNAIGAVPAPLTAGLTLRGLKTLELRVLRHAENADASRPRSNRIRWCGASTIRGSPHIRHDVARGRCTAWRDAVVRARWIRGDVTEFVSNRRFFALGESLGGVKSLICLRHV